jgi:hypothetical protein
MQKILTNLIIMYVKNMDEVKARHGLQRQLKRKRNVKPQF